LINMGYLEKLPAEAGALRSGVSCKVVKLAKLTVLEGMGEVNLTGLIINGEKAR
jgi:hypothetical protein